MAGLTAVNDLEVRHGNTVTLHSNIGGDDRDAVVVYRKAVVLAAIF